MRKKQIQSEGADPLAKSKTSRIRRSTADMAATPSASTPKEKATKAAQIAAETPPGPPKPKRVYRNKNGITQPIESSGPDVSEPSAAPPGQASVKKPTSALAPKPSTPKELAAAPEKPTQPSTQQTERMIAEKRETPVEMPVPKAVREPLKPLAARPPASGPAGLAGSAQDARTAVSAPPEKEKPKAKFELPEILFEGDERIAPLATTGPGRKFVLGPGSAPPKEPPKMQTLPQRLGSGNLTLTARDPHSLFAHWDLSIDQHRGYLADASARHLSIRLRAQTGDSAVVSETAVLTETRHWFLHAPQAGTRYIAELGYYIAAGEWVSIATSAPASTPPDTFSADRTVKFAEMPRPAQTPIAAPPAAGFRCEVHPPYQAPEAHHQGHSISPARSNELISPPVPPVAESQAEWTPAQERALDEIVTAMIARQEWFDSFQLVEMVEQRRGVGVRIPGAALKPPFAIDLPGPSSLELLAPELGPESISSPFGIEEQKSRRDFWFNLNAELIIYGATDPTARVTIGGREIKLRPDGTFSYRFALPDGQYDLPAEAVSVDDDRRRAELRFSRKTKYQGEVGAHPQDQRLKVPAPENVS